VRLRYPLFIYFWNVCIFIHFLWKYRHTDIFVLEIQTYWYICSGNTDILIYLFWTYRHTDIFVLDNTDILIYLFWTIQTYWYICSGQYRHTDIFVLDNTDILIYLFWKYRHTDIFVLDNTDILIYLFWTIQTYWYICSGQYRRIPISSIDIISNAVFSNSSTISHDSFIDTRWAEKHSPSDKQDLSMKIWDYSHINVNNTGLFTYFVVNYWTYIF
jgi:hypothetical protein